jgi:hypothetical protein
MAGMAVHRRIRQHRRRLDVACGKLRRADSAELALDGSGGGGETGENGGQGGGTRLA